MGLEDLSRVVNRLQGVCTSMGDGVSGGKGALWSALPQIVVIGGQSSGKSSVLESVVGRDFLPRGSGIVTRRPLVLQLVQEDVGREYGEFLHDSGRRHYDMEEIRREIEAETFRKLGKGIAVSPDPIQLTFYSASVPNLTLVDMPGLTKFATQGQPDSIVADIENMARMYIESENGEFDPEGARTIGVLTKLDLMDKGTGEEILRHSPQVRRRREHGIRQAHRQARLEALGEDLTADRGAMLHTTLMLAREFEEAFSEHLSHGEGGGEKIRGHVFEGSLRREVGELPMAPIFNAHNVQKTVSRADGYQAHLVAPEHGYRKLIEQGVELLKAPAVGAVEATHAILMDILEGTASGDIAPEGLAAYPGLKSELTTFAAATLSDLRSATRGVVESMVAMEAAHMEADFFRTLMDQGDDDTEDEPNPLAGYESGEGGEGPAGAEPAEGAGEKETKETGVLYNESPEVKKAAHRIGKTCRAYVDNVADRLVRTVPKAVIYYQVGRAQKQMLESFYAALASMSEGQLREVLAEDASVVRERRECTQRLAFLKAARDEIVRSV